MSEKRWVIKEMMPNSIKVSSRKFQSRARFILPELDKHLRFFIPALFSEIKIMPDKIIVEVPFQVAQRVAENLSVSYYGIKIPLEVVGV